MGWPPVARRGQCAQHTQGWDQGGEKPALLREAAMPALRNGAKSKGHSIRAEAPSGPIWPQLQKGLTETMLLLRRGVSLKVFRKGADKACLREKAKL